MNSSKLGTLLFIVIFITTTTFGQKITLSELQGFSSNKNWEITNKSLLSKKWDFYNSTKGDDEHYDVIQWSFARNHYDDKKAQAWVYLYNYDGLPNKIMYRFREKDYYISIQSQLKTFAYNLTDESIFDERVTATYENKDYILKIAYNRESSDKDVENDYGYSNDGNNKKTFTVYEISIFKRGGIYDPNNGLKKEYDEEGNLTFEYFLKNNKIEGKAKVYESDGRISGEYNFKNGEKEGRNINNRFIENLEAYFETVSYYKNGLYDGSVITYLVKPDEKYICSIYYCKKGSIEGKAYETRENIIIEQNYSNNSLNGEYIEYLDLKNLVAGYPAKIDTLSLPKIIILKQNYLNNKLNGSIVEYDATGSIRKEGQYLDNLQTGSWKFYYDNVDDENGKKLAYSGKLFLTQNYAKGMRNGSSEQLSYLDEIEIPCLNNEDAPCYEFKISYFTLKSNYKNDMLYGDYEVFQNDGELFLRGTYSNDQRLGKWIIFGESEYSELIYDYRTYEEGYYSNDLKEGIWNRFNPKGDILETYEYISDKINGKHITYQNGKIFANKYFKSGVLEKIEYFDEDGEIFVGLEIVANQNNRLVVAETWYNDDLIELYTYKISNFKKHLVNPRFFLREFAQLTDSEKALEGLYELHDKTEKVITSGRYSTNKKDGTWTYYDYNQNIKSTYVYDRDIVKEESYFDLKKNEAFSGEFVYTNVATNITEERKIKNGKRNGTTRYRDQNNKTIKKESYKEGILKE